jgi:hypothetical protein
MEVVVTVVEENSRAVVTEHRCGDDGIERFVGTLHVCRLAGGECAQARGHYDGGCEGTVRQRGFGV